MAEEVRMVVPSGDLGVWVSPEVGEWRLKGGGTIVRF